MTKKILIPVEATDHGAREATISQHTRPWQNTHVGVAPPPYIYARDDRARAG
jgi:hypothetical protein